MDEEDIRGLLFDYSEWLDAEQELVVGERDGDERSHEDLVDEFLESKKVEA